MKLWKLALAAALAVAVTGCGKKEAEVPKNPVPMEKPGQAADPTGGKGGAQPSEKLQPIPK